MSVRFELPKGVQFGTIVADPPWPFEPENKKQFAMGHRQHYDRMSLAEICAIPVGDFIHPDGHLHLWTTNPALEMALEVVKAWGFTYKTMGTWRKTKLGLGWWLRSRTEHCILAARSTEKRVQPGAISTEIVGPWRGDSVKPDITERVEALSPGPYLELFSRGNAKPREGWVRLGAHGVPTEPFNQSSFMKPGSPNAPDKNDGVIRGIGGLEIVKDEEYFYLEKTITPIRVRVVGQTNRKVYIEVPIKKGRKVEIVKKGVSIDNLRGLDWEVPERSGQRKVVKPNA